MTLMGAYMSLTFHYSTYFPQCQTDGHTRIYLGFHELPMQLDVQGHSMQCLTYNIPKPKFCIQ